METTRDYLEDLLDRTITEHRRRRNLLRTMSWTVKVSCTALGATATVVLGVTTSSPGYQTFSRNVALALCAAITFLSSLTAMWDLDSHRLNRKVTLARLTLLRDEYRFLATGADPIAPARLDDFFARYLTIVEQHAGHGTPSDTASPSPSPDPAPRAKR